MAEGIRAACGTTYGLVRDRLSRARREGPPRTPWEPSTVRSPRTGGSRALRAILHSRAIAELVRLFAAVHALELLRERLLTAPSAP